MNWINKAVLMLGILLLAGCVGGISGSNQWEVRYSDNARFVATSGIQITSINVVVPQSLTVSEENSFAPDADIVWRGEVLGDRRAQVRQIIYEAASQATSGLSGSRSARLEIQVHTFHALSDIARARAPSGVHNVGFFATLVDARTGEVIVPREDISADLNAYVGEDAIRAEIEGNGQRVRIVRHVNLVLRAWLGLPGVNRDTFNQLGR